MPQINIYHENLRCSGLPSGCGDSHFSQMWLYKIPNGCEKNLVALWL